MCGLLSGLDLLNMCPFRADAKDIVGENQVFADAAVSLVKN